MSNKRNLSLAPRAEDTREVQPVSVVNFELSEIKDHFDQSLTAIKNQFEVASSLGSDGKTEDQKNIYRSQIVFLESAFRLSIKGAFLLQKPPLFQSKT